METTSLSGNAETVAWVCFGLGVALVVIGLIIGLVLSFQKVSKDVEKKVEAAQNEVDELKGAAVRGSLNPSTDQDAADAVDKKAESVKSTLGEIGSIVASLPEHLRFAGLLILIGAVLMSVGTIQFGGHSIF